MSRPTEFSPEVATRICEEIETGKSLVKVCESEDMPSRSTVYGWLAKVEPEFKAFSDNYARAVEARAEHLAEEIIAIADDDSLDIGFKESEDKDGKGAKPFINQDNIQRAKLRVDARKWTASKLFPRKYGDKVQTEHSGTIGVSIADQIRKAHENA